MESQRTDEPTPIPLGESPRGASGPRRLIYVADPMCSWCYGFAPVLAQVEARLEAELPLTLVLGGLAPDDDAPMEEGMRRYVQDAWRAVEARTGARFEHAFWERQEPRRSTWPACRAVILAGARGREMFAAIQRAYYAEARDPSRRETLVELAEELGLDADDLERRLDAPETHALLARHLAQRDRLGVRAYPSLVLEEPGSSQSLASGWSPAGPILDRLDAAGALA